MALNSGEAEEQGKQDVSGLSADIVMEDASLVEPVQGAPASLSSTLEPPSLEASGDSGVLPAPEAAEPAEPSSSSLCCWTKGALHSLMFWKTCFLHVILPFFWMKMHGGSGWNAK